MKLRNVIKYISAILISFSILYIPSLPLEIETIDSLSTISEDGNPNRKFEKLGKMARTTNNYTGETYTEGLAYTLVEADHTASISAGSVTSGYVYLPSYYVDENQVTYTVTSIANNGFKEVEITSISQWPTLLTVIGKQAFMGISTMTHLSLPAGIKEIYPSTFQNCKNLTYFSFHADSLITRIWNRSFAGCDYLSYTYDGLSSFNLPNGLLTIDSSAFAYCVSLPRIIIPSSVETIKENAFYNCVKVVLISIPESVTTIEKWAFRGIRNTKIYLQSTTLPTTYATDWNRIGNGTGSSTASSYYIQYVLGIDSIDVQNDFLYIVQSDGYAYIYGYVGLNSVITIPDTLNGKTVKGILSRAFYSNTALTSITTNASLKSIGSEAFRGCSNLTTINLNEGLLTIDAEAFNPDTTNKVSSLHIPSTVTSISENAFANFKVCQELYFDGVNDGTNQLFYIGNNAFNSMGFNSGAKADGFELIIPAMPTTVSSEINTRLNTSAFANCYFITTLTFKQDTASSYTRLGQSCFEGCKYLSTINWADWIYQISDYCFKDCSYLPYIYIPSTIIRLGTNLIDGVQASIYFEDAFLNHRSTNGSTLSESISNQSISWNGTNSSFIPQYSGIYCNIGEETNIYKDTSSTGGYYYIIDDNSYIQDAHEPTGTHITISGFVKTNKYLGLEANSSTINIPETFTINGTIYNVTEIGRGAFSGNSDIKKVEIPNEVSFFGISAFYACTNLTQIVGYTGASYNSEYQLPTKLSYISSSCFINTKIVYFILPINVEIYVPEIYFSSSYNMDTDTLTRLSVFTYITPLIGISLGTSYSTDLQVGRYAITKDGCVYTNPNNTSYNGFCLLYALPYALNSLTTYSGCNKIGRNVSQVNELNDITINYGVTHIYSLVFQNSISLRSVTLPTTLRYLSKDAFANCDNITSFSTIDEHNNIINNGTIVSFVTDKEGTGDLQYIGDNAFNGCDNITGFILPLSDNLSMGNKVFGIKTSTIYISDTYEIFYDLHYASESFNPWIEGLWNQDVKDTVYYKSTPPTKEEMNLRNYWHYVNDLPTIWTTTSN